MNDNSSVRGKDKMSESAKVKMAPQSKRAPKLKVHKKEDNSHDDKSAKRPNWFLAIQIEDSDLIEQVIKIQEAMIEMEPQLKSAQVSVKKAHMPLYAFNVENVESVEKMVNEHLNECALANLKLEDMTIKAETIGNFSHRVIFVKMELDQALLAFCQNLGRKLLQNKIIDEDGLKSFNPHLNLFKLSQVKQWKNKDAKPLRKIPMHLYADWVNHAFGSQKVSAIQLLSMTRPLDDNGYYYCHQTFTLNAKIQPLEQASEAKVEATDNNNDGVKETVDTESVEIIDDQVIDNKPVPVTESSIEHGRSNGITENKTSTDEVLELNANADDDKESIEVSSNGDSYAIKVNDVKENESIHVEMPYFTKDKIVEDIVQEDSTVVVDDKVQEMERVVESSEVTNNVHAVNTSTEPIEVKMTHMSNEVIDIKENSETTQEMVNDDKENELVDIELPHFNKDKIVEEVVQEDPTRIVNDLEKEMERIDEVANNLQAVKIPTEPIEVKRPHVSDVVLKSYEEIVQTDPTEVCNEQPTSIDKKQESIDVISQAITSAQEVKAFTEPTDIQVQSEVQEESVEIIDLGSEGLGDPIEFSENDLRNIEEKTKSMFNKIEVMRSLQNSLEHDAKSKVIMSESSEVVDKKEAKVETFDEKAKKNVKDSIGVVTNVVQEEVKKSVEVTMVKLTNATNDVIKSSKEIVQKDYVEVCNDQRKSNKVKQESIDVAGTASKVVQEVKDLTGPSNKNLQSEAQAESVEVSNNLSQKVEEETKSVFNKIEAMRSLKNSHDSADKSKKISQESVEVHDKKEAKDESSPFNLLIFSMMGVTAVLGAGFFITKRLK